MTALVDAPTCLVEVSFTDWNATPSWTDVTPYVLWDRGIQGSRGRSSLYSSCQPSELSFALDNSDGRFNPALSTGPYYGTIKTNNPVRLRAFWSDSVNLCQNPMVTSTWLFSGSSAFWGTASTISLESTSPIQNGTTSLQVDWPTTNYSSTFTGVQYQIDGLKEGVTYTASLYVYVTAGPNVRLEVWSGATGTSGTTSSGTGSWQRLSVTWTHSVGAGRYAYLHVRPQGATTATTHYCHIDSLQIEKGNSATTWTAIGGEWIDLYYGYISRWPTEWPGGVIPSGVSQIQATCWMRRAGQVILDSYPVEVLTALGQGVVATWPLTEPSGSTSFGEVSGTNYVTTSFEVATRGTPVAGSVVAGAGTAPGPENEPCPVFTRSSATIGRYLRATGWTGTTRDYPNPAYHVIAFKTTTTGAIIFGTGASTISNGLHLRTDGTGKAAVVRRTSGVTRLTVTSTMTVTDGEWHVAVVGVSTSGTTETIKLRIDQSAQGSGNWTLPSSFAKFFPVMHYLGGCDTDEGALPSDGQFSGSIAYYSVYRDVTLSTAQQDALAASMMLSSAEATGTRFSRLLAIGFTPQPGTVVDTGASSAIAQPTKGKSLSDALDDLARHELGVWYVNASGKAVFYDRTRRYNLASTLTVHVGNNLRVPPSLAHDDFQLQQIGNEVEVSRPNGSRYIVKDSASITDYGSYRTSLTSLASSDAGAIEQAEYLISTAAQPKTRVDQVVVDLFTTVPQLATAPAIDWHLALSADVGQKITLSNAPSVVGTLATDLIIEGVSWRISPTGWLIAWNVSASDGVAVWKLGDSTYGVLGSTTKVAY